MDQKHSEYNKEPPPWSDCDSEYSLPAENYEDHAQYDNLEDDLNKPNEARAEHTWCKGCGRKDAHTLEIQINESIEGRCWFCIEETETLTVSGLRNLKLKAKTTPKPLRKKAKARTKTLVSHGVRWCLACGLEAQPNNACCDLSDLEEKKNELHRITGPPWCEDCGGKLSLDGRYCPVCD